MLYEEIISIFLVVASLLPFGVMFMVFNTILSNISVILWRSVLLVEETGEPRKKSPI
jgi:hypothetical protein